MIEPGELRALEDEVSVALATRDPSRLSLLGHGEVSLVLGWPPGQPRVACKRLPPFRDAAAFGRYAAVVRRYIDELRAGGVRVVETELQHLVRPDGRIVGFHVQSALPAGALGSAILRTVTRRMAIRSSRRSPRPWCGSPTPASASTRS